MQFTWLLGLHTIYYMSLVVFTAVPMSLWGAGLAGLLIWISLVDCLRFEIPDLASLALTLFAAGWLYSIDPDRMVLADHLAGAIIWPMLFFLTARLYRHQRGFEGLGLGDAKLMVGLGLLCGFQGAVLIVLIASLSAAGVLFVVTLCQTAGRKPPASNIWMTGISFGPFLCAAAWYVWLSNGWF